MELQIGEGKLIRLMQGDITKVPADAICNAANSRLAGGGGVDGAIHRAGGPSIMAELNLIRAQHGGCPTGSAVLTGAGNLPAKYVIHAVGPVYRDGHQGEPALLASAYSACMKLAEENQLRTLSFPSISTGIYGYPVEKAAPIAVRAVSERMKESHYVREVVFVLFDRETFDAYSRALAALAP